MSAPEIQFLGADFFRNGKRVRYADSFQKEEQYGELQFTRAKSRNFDADFFLAGKIRHWKFFQRGARVCSFSKESGAELLADFADGADRLWRFALSELFDFRRESLFY